MQKCLKLILPSAPGVREKPGSRSALVGQNQVATVRRTGSLKHGRKAAITRPPEAQFRKAYHCDGQCQGHQAEEKKLPRRQCGRGRAGGLTFAGSHSIGFAAAKVGKDGREFNHTSFQSRSNPAEAAENGR